MLAVIPVFLALIVYSAAIGPVKFQLQFDADIPLEGYASNYDGLVPYAFEKEINKTINDIIRSIPDPLLIPKFVIDTNNSPSFRANVTLENLDLIGSSTIVASNIKFDLIKTLFDITIHIGKLDFSTFYDADVQILFVPLYGKGSVRLVIDNADLKLHAKLKLGKPTVLTEFTIDGTLSNIDFYLTGFLNNDNISDIISTAVTEQLPGFIKKYGPVLAKKLSKLIQNAINEALKPKPKPKFPNKGYYIPLDNGKIYYEL